MVYHVFLISVVKHKQTTCREMNLGNAEIEQKYIFKEASLRIFQQACIATFLFLCKQGRWGLTLIEPLGPYFHGWNRRNRSDWRKLSIQSTSRTRAARRGAPSINLLAGLDAPLACAPSLQTPLPRNMLRTGHTGPGTASLPDLSTRSCQTYGRSQHLGAQYLWPIQARGACCRPQAPEAMKSTNSCNP